MSTAWSCINEPTLQSGAILQPLSAATGSAAGAVVVSLVLLCSRAECVQLKVAQFIFDAFSVWLWE